MVFLPCAVTGWTASISNLQFIQDNDVRLFGEVSIFHVEGRMSRFELSNVKAMSVQTSLLRFDAKHGSGIKLPTREAQHAHNERTM